MVLEILEKVKSDLLEEIDFLAELTVPFSGEDREGKDIKITFLNPESIRGRMLYLQVKSSPQGAKIFRERHNGGIHVVVVGKNKDPQRDMERIKRFLAGVIRQELRK